MARQVLLNPQSETRSDLRRWSERVTSALEQGAAVRQLETPEVKAENFCDYFLHYFHSHSEGVVE